jgi:hypothetical protein
MSFSLNEEQRAALQVRHTNTLLWPMFRADLVKPEVQRELEKREWAEPGDNVMAEYVTVLLGKLSCGSRDKLI